jgi:hypothetical protein
MRSADRIGYTGPWAVPAGFVRKRIAAMFGLTGLVVFRPAPAGSIVLECPRLAVDGYRLYRFLTYYADNPSARVELGTPAATERWATVR